MNLKDMEPALDLGLCNADETLVQGGCLGSMYASLTYGSITIEGWINVFGVLSNPLLSWKHAQLLNIIPSDYPLQIQTSCSLGNSKPDGRHASASFCQQVKHPYTRAKNYTYVTSASVIFTFRSKGLFPEGVCRCFEDQGRMQKGCSITADDWTTYKNQAEV